MTPTAPCVKRDGGPDAATAPFHRDMRERGVAALALTMVLCLATLLGIAFANRSLFTEQRGARNQSEAVQTFEAAEAGVEWAVAMLNSNQPIGDDCLPTTGPAARSFRERYGSLLPSGTGVPAATPSSAAAAAGAGELQPSCMRDGDGWNCTCPSLPGLAATGAERGTVAFVLHVERGARPGLLHVGASGCTDGAGSCTASRSGATATVRATLALLPALAKLPAAAIVARGAVAADDVLFDLGANGTAGLAVQAGSAAALSRARLKTAPAVLPPHLVQPDPALTSRPRDRFFAMYFGLSPNPWAAQPVVRAMSCSNGSGCVAAVQAALDLDRGPSLIHAAGDLRLEGPATIGSAERPALIVVDGALELAGDVMIHGLVYAATVRWNGGPAARPALHGALLSAGDVEGTGVAEITYDRAVLQRLQAGAGTFVRVNGSWRDF
ncbi:MAG: hypothetical protein ACJ8G7_01930 [Rhizobacter sp.]